MSMVMMLTLGYLAGILSLLGVMAAARGIRRPRTVREAPVPYADYDETNPINQGGRRWHPSRVQELDPAQMVRTDEGPEGFERMVDENGKEWWIRRAN